MDKYTAYHEAGHAVASYRLGFHIGPATIVPDSETGNAGSSAGEEYPYEEYIVALYAGGAAGRRFDPSAVDDGCGQDNAEAADLLKTLNCDENTLRQQAEELVVKHWAEIEAVAQVLWEEKTLPGDDIDFICDAVAEGTDWRAELRIYRDRRG